MTAQEYLDKANQAQARKDTAEILIWARKCLEIDRGNVNAATMVARVLEVDSLADAVTVLRQAVQTNPDATAKATLLCELLPVVERIERASRKLPPYHVLDMREFPFAFCDAEMGQLREIWSRIKPGDPAYLSLGPVAEFLLGNRERADVILQQIAAGSPKKRVPGSYATVRYAANFYAQLGEVNFAGLPQVQLMKEARFSTSHVLYVGCDVKYFEAYALPLLRSLAANAPGADAHLHLMIVEGQPPPSLRKLDLNLCVTCEVIPKGLDSPLYYHAMRLVRLYQFLQDRTLWMIDADALANRDPATLYARLNGHIGIRVRPGRAQPWNQFSAALVAATPQSKDYFRLVAAYLTHFIFTGNFTWGMDQMALYGVYQYLESKPSLTLWGPDEFEVERYGDDGVFWFTAGASKDAYRTGAVPATPAQAKYWERFRRYEGP